MVRFQILHANKYHVVSAESASEMVEALKRARLVPRYAETSDIGYAFVESSYNCTRSFDEIGNLSRVRAIVYTKPHAPAAKPRSSLSTSSTASTASTASTSSSGSNSLQPHSNEELDYTLFLEALLESGDDDRVRAQVKTLLYQRGVDPRGLDSKSWSPLAAAAQHGRDQALLLMMEWLQEHNVDVCEALSASADTRPPNPYGDTKTYAHFTPLTIAARAGHVHCAQVLLDAGVDVNAVTGEYTALTTAAGNGQVKMVEFLLSRGASVDGRAGTHTALINAVRVGDLNMVKVLLDVDGVRAPETRADLNLDADYFSPLRNAVRYDHRDIAELLLERGADPDLVIQDRSPLMDAVNNGQMAMMELLLEHGASHALCVGSCTPLSHAVFKGQIDFVRTLIAHGAAVNPLEAADDSPLMMAAFHNHLDIAELLLDVKGERDIAQRAEVDPVHATPYSPLISASRRGHLAMAQLLLDHGADVNRVPNGRCHLIDGVGSHQVQHNDMRWRFSPLLTAVRYNHPDMFKLLLAHGAEVNVIVDKFSPLTSVIHSGFHDFAALLLDLRGERPIEQRANVELVVGGRSPLDWAVYENDERMVALLLEAGADVSRLRMRPSRGSPIRDLLQGQ